MTDAARTFLNLGALFRIDDIVARAGDLAVTDDYDRLAIEGSFASLGAAHRRLAVAALRSGVTVEGTALPAELGANADRTRVELGVIADAHEPSIARLAVAAARLADLVQTVDI